MNPRNLWIVLLLCGPLRAEVALEAYGEIPASTRDSLGDTAGGFGSAVAYDARTGSVFMMPDRGAGDGTIDYRPRCYRLEIRRDASDPKRLDGRIVETILFRDAGGRPFTGLKPDHHTSATLGTRPCLDPEAIAVAPDGTLYVSDEYRPALMHFDRQGLLLREIPLPAWYQPRNSHGALEYRENPSAGREENRGAEAMGILPGGRRAVLILQSALLQDGGKPAGTSRVLVLDLRTGRPVAEYAYAFTDAPAWGLKFRALSVNDLAVVDVHTLLVLERDDLGRDGAVRHLPARYKSVWLVDLRGATNLLRLRGAPFDQSPADPAFKPIRRDTPINFVRKTRLFNLPGLARDFGFDPSRLATKWEGITLLPPRSKKEFHLLMTADNDFLSPILHLDGRSIRFPRAQDAVPTQFFEITAARP